MYTSVLFTLIYIHVYLHVQGHGRSTVSNVSTNFILKIRPCFIFKFTQYILTTL